MVRKGLCRHMRSDLFVKQYECSIRRGIRLIWKFDHRAAFNHRYRDRNRRDRNVQFATTDMTCSVGHLRFLSGGLSNVTCENLASLLQLYIQLVDLFACPFDRVDLLSHEWNRERQPSERW